MYSLRNLLAQSPEKVKNWFLRVSAAGVIYATAKGYAVDGAFVAAVGIALESTLDLLYVAPVRQAQAEAAALVAFENVKVKAESPTTVVQNFTGTSDPTPPPPPPPMPDPVPPPAPPPT